MVFPELERTLQGRVFTDIQLKALDYFKKITGNAFNEVIVKSGKKGETSYALKNNLGLQMSGPEFLSDGTRDQLFFALRFAMINQFSSTEPKFIVLDEPFAHTDTNREKKMRDILDVFVKEGWQVIVFSCK